MLERENENALERLVDRASASSPRVAVALPP
jgi:hypothetical protein